MNRMIDINKILKIVAVVLVGLLTVGLAFGQSTLTVCDNGNQNSYVPIHVTNRDYYLKSEFIIPASYLSSMTGTITKMEFYSTTTGYAMGSYKVFLKVVDNTAISEYLGTEGATIVYDGSLSISSYKVAVNFTTNFEYNGGNLLVGIYTSTPGSEITSFSGMWYGKEVSDASVQGHHASNMSLVPATQRSFIPKITFTYTPCVQPAGTFSLPTGLCNVMVADIGTTVNLSGNFTSSLPSGGTFTYQSYDTDVATVNSSGVVTFVGEGATTIHIKWSHSDYCSVTLNYPVVVSDGCARIGTGSAYTENNVGTHGGVYTYTRSYAYTQQLYTAAELSAAGVAAGVLNYITLHYKEETSSTYNFEIYLGQTSATSVPTTWVTDASLQQVYSGSYTFTPDNNGWNSIDISSANWQWNGTSNLLIAFRRTNPDDGCCSDFYYTNSPNMMAYQSSLTNQITLNANNVSTYTGSVVNSGEERPEIKFCFGEANPCNATPMTCEQTYTGSTTTTSTVVCTSGTYIGNGGEAFYSFVPTATANYSFGAFVTSGSPVIMAIATDCQANDVLASTVVIPNSSAPEEILSANLIEGTTYYIILDAYSNYVSSAYSVTAHCDDVAQCNDLNNVPVGGLPSDWTYMVNVWSNPNSWTNYSTSPATISIINAQHSNMMREDISSYRSGETCAAVGSECLYIEYAPARKTYCQDVYLYPPVMHLYPATYAYSVLYSSEVDMSINYSALLEGMIAGSVCNLYYGTTPNYTQMTQMSDLIWQYTRTGWESYTYTTPTSACNSFVRINGKFEITTEGDYYVGMKIHANSYASSDNTYPAYMTLDKFCIEPLTPIITCTHLDSPTLNVVQETDRSVRVSWNSVPNASSYILYYGVNDPNSSTNNVWSVTNATSPMTIPELTNGQPYNFAVMPVGTDSYCPENPLSTTRQGTPNCDE